MKAHPLRVARVSQGMSQLDLAKLLRTSDTRLSLVERGFTVLSDAEMRFCVNLFGIEREKLFPGVTAENREFLAPKPEDARNMTQPARKLRDRTSGE